MAHHCRHTCRDVVGRRIDLTGTVSSTAASGVALPSKRHKLVVVVIIITVTANTDTIAISITIAIIMTIATITPLNGPDDDND